METNCPKKKERTTETLVSETKTIANLDMLHGHCKKIDLAFFMIFSKRHHP